MALQLTEWNTLDYLKSDEDIALYLEGCFAEADGDTGFIIQALQTAAKARHLNQAIAESDGKPLSFVEVFDFIKALNLKIEVSPIKGKMAL